MWQAVIAFQDYPFKKATGLPFRYKLKVGKNGEYNRELLIDQREKSKKNLKDMMYEDVTTLIEYMRKFDFIVEE